MADREQRLQLEVTRLKSDRDALIDTRNEYNKELQEERTLQIRLLQERDTLIAEERARHAQQIHEKDRLLQERDATIVELRNQRLNDRTSIQDLKREIEDMRAQQDVEAPPVHPRAGNDRARRTPAPTPKPPPKIPAPKPPLSAGPSQQETTRTPRTAESAVASSSKHKLGLSIGVRVNSNAQNTIEIFDSDEEPEQQQSPSPAPCRPVATSLNKVQKGPSEYQPMATRSGPPSSHKRKQVPPASREDHETKKARHIDEPGSSKGKQKQNNDSNPNASALRTSRATVHSESVSSKQKQADSSDAELQPRRMTRAAVNAIASSSTSVPSNLSYNDTTTKPKQVKRPAQARHQPQAPEDGRISQSIYRDFGYNCKEGVTFRFVPDDGDSQDKAPTGNPENVLIKPGMVTWIMSFGHALYPVSIVAIHSKYPIEDGVPIPPDDTALQCHPHITAVDIGLRYPEVDTDSDEFKRCYGILGGTELVEFRESHYYLGSVVGEPTTIRKFDEYKPDLPLLSLRSFYTRYSLATSVQKLVNEFKRPNGSVHKFHLPGGRHCIQTGKCPRTWSPDDEEIRYCTGCGRWYHVDCIGKAVSYAHVRRHVENPHQTHLRNTDQADPMRPTFEVLARLPIVRRLRKPSVSREDDNRDSHYSPLSLEMIITSAIEVILRQEQDDYPDIWTWCLSVQGGTKDKDFKLLDLTKIAVKAALTELQGGDVGLVNVRLRATFDVDRWFECPSCAETAFL